MNPAVLFATIGSDSEEGIWSFETYSSKPELSGLAGQVSIAENARANQKGAVGIDPENHQAFVHEDGDSHFMLAFELDWLFALDYNNDSGLPRTEQLIFHQFSWKYGFFKNIAYALDLVP